MRIRVTNMRPLERRRDKLLALCDVVLHDQWRLNGVRVVDSQSGPFVSLPARHHPDGHYEPIVHPTTREAREAISRAVLDAFHHAQPVTSEQAATW